MFPRIPLYFGRRRERRPPSRSPPPHHLPSCRDPVDFKDRGRTSEVCGPTPSIFIGHPSTCDVQGRPPVHRERTTIVTLREGFRVGRAPLASPTRRRTGRDSLSPVLPSDRLDTFVGEGVDPSRPRPPFGPFRVPTQPTVGSVSRGYDSPRPRSQGLSVRLRRGVSVV